MGKVLLDPAVSLDGFTNGADGADAVGRGVYGRADDATGWDETPDEVPHLVVTHRSQQGLAAWRLVLTRVVESPVVTHLRCCVDGPAA